MRILRRRGYRLVAADEKSRRTDSHRPGGGHVCSGQPLVWRHLAQLPQGRKAARVSELCRVHEGSLLPDVSALADARPACVVLRRLGT